MNQKEKIEELEKRIRELEARPVYVPIYVVPSQPVTPQPEYTPWWRNPWYCVSGTTALPVTFG